MPTAKCGGARRLWRVVVPAAILATAFLPTAVAQHPRLLLTPDDARMIVESLDQSPSFARTLERKRVQTRAWFASPPDVPEPKDPGGGYTHEQHKKNGIAIHDAGILFQLTGDSDYASWARHLLVAYAQLYPGLGEHPVERSRTPGRLFWQTLNESVWLVYAIQGFDAIYGTLSGDDRELIETALLRPMADFLSIGQPETFDRMHNHATWAAAAVGMTGFVLDDESLLRRALLGLDGDGRAGFLRQLDVLFSPDGYYTEGPYYQRYALMPFVVFARAIEQNAPELEIFKHRNGVLEKAILACIDLSYAGLFFPLNDAIKDKGLDTVELRYGLSIAYGLTGDPAILSAAGVQSSFVPTGDGFRMARAIDQGGAVPLEWRSVLLRDGPAGRQGGLAVLRSGGATDPQALVLKASSQGMGHGHYDKLAWLFYDNGQEIITDYGAARFLNVEQKRGGSYLPENSTWAKQTIAHNTLVVDETSHFDAKLSVAETLHPAVTLFDSTNDVQIAAAAMHGAYDEVAFDRTTALLHGVTGDRAIAIDVLRADGRGEHQFDLPLHFNGQIIDVSHPVEANTTLLQPLGESNGYQHLWLRARADVAAAEQFSVTWLTGNRFYTFTTIAHADMEVLFTELGANDPDFNLRRQQALVLRVRDSRDQVFTSLLEPHGEYNGAEEFTIDSRPRIARITHVRRGQADALRLTAVDGHTTTLLLSYDPDEAAAHALTVEDHDYHWNGYYALFVDGERRVDERPKGRSAPPPAQPRLARAAQQRENTDDGATTGSSAMDMTHERSDER